MKLLTKKNNFLFLAMLSFVFISTSAMAISGQVPTVHSSPFTVHESKTFPQIPLSSDDQSFPTFSAQGVLAVDLTSGVTLYEKNPDEKYLPASTTKIVTALVALDTYGLDQILTVPKIKVDGQKMGLFAGEQLKFEDLLYGLLVYSANDAAETIADNFPGGRDVFINKMNEKATELFMTNSHFQNPVGLDDETQFSTARDLVRASEVGLRNPEFAKIVSTKSVILKDVAGRNIYNLKNINELLGVVPGVMGIKTGWTESARENLVTYIERDNHKVAIVVLGSQDRFGETKELINWIFDNYKWEEVTPN